jgi:hypothetical protein
VFVQALFSGWRDARPKTSYGKETKTSIMFFENFGLSVFLPAELKSVRFWLSCGAAENSGP